MAGGLGGTIVVSDTTVISNTYKLNADLLIMDERDG